MVVQDPRVQSLGAWWASMPGIRPLLKLSYAIDHAAGLGAGGFHAVNVAIHATNVAILCALFSARSRGAAVLTTIVFALVPIQTEAVTYVSGRSTSLSALFSLASVLAWTRGRRPLSAALFGAGLCVKEVAIVVPAAIVLWEATGPERRPRWREIAGSLSGHAAVVIAAAAVAAASPTYRHLAATSIATRSIAMSLATQAEAIPYLALRIVRPDLLNADPALPAATAWSIGSALSALAIVALIVFALASIRTRPDLALGVLWFFLWIAPTNSLLPRLDVVNDRQAYVALVGPAWIAATALVRLGLPQRALAAAGVVLAVVLGTGTIHRNEVYRSEIAFWEDVTAKAPANARAFNNLGYAYALAARDAPAEAAFRRALRLDPTLVRAGVNLRLLREGALTDARPRP